MLIRYRPYAKTHSMYTNPEADGFDVVISMSGLVEYVKEGCTPWMYSYIEGTEVDLYIQTHGNFAIEEVTEEDIDILLKEVTKYMTDKEREDYITIQKGHLFINKDKKIP